MAILQNGHSHVHVNYFSTLAAVPTKIKFKITKTKLDWPDIFTTTPKLLFNCLLCSAGFHAAYGRHNPSSIYHPALDYILYFVNEAYVIRGHAGFDILGTSERQDLGSW